ncbi:hypothetical protein RJ640_023645 [Escallonia rubra]|uniref:Pentatricopeptide repeat-containing protein n=1 Tax=Escallonia rubra TaxID=112253 RepID=A0AA88UJH9_9ASTE|nr:hypothetical protein RJ640_023645 [Escallonia rubra]
MAALIGRPIAPRCYRSFAKSSLVTLLSCLKLQSESQSHQYHTMNQSKTDLSMPRLDYTVNQDVVRSNWTITKLSREGRIDKARQLFEEMPERDVITWTAVITGYVKCGLIREARDLFDRVDAKINVVTWTAMVSGYLRMDQVSEAEKLFHEMPDKNVVSWNTMVEGYVKNGRIDSALSLFEKMPEKNVVSWNTIMTALAQFGRIEEAESLFHKMPKRDVISWTAMVSGLSKNGRVDEARMLFDRMPERNVVSWNAMITGYAQNKRLDDAFDLFERLPKKNLPSWNTMVTGFIQNGDLRRARKMFNDMPQKNVISWTMLIAGYVQDGQDEEALYVFLEMLAANLVKPNQGTFVSALGACSNLAGVSEGKQIHQIISKTLYQDSDFVVCALINMYSKCGELVMARKMFDDGLKSQRDLVFWNGMIAAYAHHGCGRSAIYLFNEMQNMGIKPNDVTYVGLLTACSHAGLVEEGLKYFNKLVRDSSIQVREDHYACLVDLCVRAGRVKEAFDFLEQLPTKLSVFVWGALLAGCNVHENTNIGNVAAKKLLEGEPENAGTYSLLSNLYASSGKWNEAAKMRLEMREKGLKKQPGCSWIEVGNRVHVFVVGDSSHLESFHVQMGRNNQEMRCEPEYYKVQVVIQMTFLMILLAEHCQRQLCPEGAEPKGHKILQVKLTPSSKVSSQLRIRADARGPEEEILAVAKLAQRCVNLIAKKRPVMKEVAAVLDQLGRIGERPLLPQKFRGSKPCLSTKFCFVKQKSRTTVALLVAGKRKPSSICFSFAHGHGKVGINPHSTTISIPKQLQGLKAGLWIELSWTLEKIMRALASLPPPCVFAGNLES